MKANRLVGIGGLLVGRWRRNRHRIPTSARLELPGAPTGAPDAPKNLEKKQSQNLTIVRKFLFYIFTK